MAKYINNKVKSGRVAGSVFSVRFGEVIERAYNPYVNNPNTPGQVEARAKLKLLSQLAAVVAPVLAMPREGAKSARNRFLSENYKLVSYNNLQADIVVNSIQLTSSTVGLPKIVLTREGENLTVRLAGSAGVGINRMVYALFVKGSDGYLRYAGSSFVETPGDFNTFTTSFAMTDVTNTFVVLGYGVRFNSEAARVKYGEMTTLTSEAIAKLIASRVLTESDVTVTETQGNTSNPA